jgi:hypothetical protein
MMEKMNSNSFRLLIIITIMLQYQLRKTVVATTTMNEVLNIITKHFPLTVRRTLMMIKASKIHLRRRLPTIFITMSNRLQLYRSHRTRHRRCRRPPVGNLLRKNFTRYDDNLLRCVVYCTVLYINGMQDFGTPCRR